MSRCMLGATSRFLLLFFLCLSVFSWLAGGLPLRGDTTQAAANDEESSSQSGEGEAGGAAAGESPAGHSYHAAVFNEGPRQSAYLMKGTGAVDFPVNASHPDVQAFINQGVGQLHGFWYFEAERSFRQAAALDPDCAAAYWGMAMANAKNRQRAQQFIEQALERKANASPRVVRYIEALDRLLKSKDAKRGSDAYLDALEKIAYDFPQDIDAKAFIALHLWEGREHGQKIRSYLAVDALIGQVLAVEPMHPAHHYRIHLWDNEKPERALASAARCGQAAPSVAHMWHMPGHIYSRLKRYPDAVWQQEASARTDHAQMIRDQILPDQIHNFAHNNEWLIRNLIFVGRIGDALDLAKNMIELPRHPKYNLLSKSGCSANYGRRRLLQVLDEGELWQETLRLAETPYLEKTETVLDQTDWLRAVGRAHYHLAHKPELLAVRTELDEMLGRQRAEQECEVQKAEQASAQEADADGPPEEETGTKDEESKPDGDDKSTEDRVKKARQKFAGEIRRLERALKEIDAYRSAMEGNLERALELLESTNEADAHLVARWQAELGRADESLETLVQQVKSHEQETLPLAHLAWQQWQLGKQDAAAKTMQQLRELSAWLDLRAPAFARLAPLAHQLKWPRDWRIPAAESSDVGERPALDSLGPFRWQPTVAPDWTLPNPEQRSLSLSDYRGRPVVVIFYLGWGCLHCAEQLHAFGPRIDDFRRAGIEVVAISSDGVEGLKKSLEAYTGEIPFPLLSDDQLHVFRHYRVFDDFENQPLHGTFLIDAQGRMRWHDISFEPFMDVQFVLNEAQRLLAQSH